VSKDKEEMIPQSPGERGKRWGEVTCDWEARNERTHKRCRTARLRNPTHDGGVGGGNVSTELGQTPLVVDRDHGGAEKRGTPGVNKVGGKGGGSGSWGKRRGNSRSF